MRLRRPLLLFVAALLVGSVACATHTDPETRAAANALEATRLVSQLQAAVITAAETGGLAASDAVVIVKFTTGALRTIQQTPYGWGPSVRQGWAEVKARYGTHPSVATYGASIEALLALVGGTS